MSMIRRLLVVLGVLGAGGIPVGCGGGVGEGAGDGADTITVAILGSAPLDGFAGSNGTSSGSGSGGGPTTGDVDSIVPGVGSRELFSFDLALIPAGATVVRATLQLVQTSVVGTPYSTHGAVVLEHVDYGASLDGGDFGLPALSTPGDISTDATLGLKTLPVTAAVQADRAAARTRSQFRVRFSLLDTDDDGANDFAQFADSELSTTGSVPGNQPVLIVEFVP